MRFLALLSTFVGALTVAGSAAAAPASITGYDVIATPASGFGGWAHVYAGDVTSTGRVIPGNVFGPIDVVNETGGGGTLNDGQTSTDVRSTHLFFKGNDADGDPIRPVIKLYLADAVRVQRILIRGGDIPFNGIPGALSGATVAIGDAQAPLNSIPTGTQVSSGRADDLLDLRATSLAGIPTTEVELRDFQSTFFGSPFDQFSIAEIVVDGIPPDTTPPVIETPEIFFSRSDDPSGAIVDFPVTAHDDVDGPVTAECSPAPGSQFAPGETTVECSAADAAGNTATASFTVLVGLTPSALCELTIAYVTESERFQALASGRRLALERRVNEACTHVDKLVERLPEDPRVKLIARYTTEVDSLATEGWLTTEQADILKFLATLV